MAKNAILDKENETLETLDTDYKIIDKDSKTYKNEFGKKSSFDILTIFFIMLISVIVTAVITIGIFSYKNMKNQNIISGIKIKGIDISKLSKEEAKTKVEEIINEKLSKEIKLKHNDYKVAIPADSLGIHFDIDSAINYASEIGKSKNIIKDDLVTIKTMFSGINIEPEFTMDENGLKELIKTMSSQLPDAVVDSGYYIDGTNLIITKGKKGYIVNEEKMLEIIKENIKNLQIEDNILEIEVLEKEPSEIDLEKIYNEIHKEPKDAYYTQNPYTVYPHENGLDFAISLEEAKNKINGNEIEYTIPLKILVPNVTTNMIGTEAFPDLLSTFSTKYAASNRNRTTNLMLAANKINGTVLMPGEEFSYNTVVGERTIAAGYKEASIYENGQVVDGLGGGICQITTTLYNAVLYANLEITQRRNHQFVPSYVGAGRDATVVYGSQDFKFKNNRDYPIKIQCSVSKGIAKFDIYGLKRENDCEVVITSRIISQTSNSIISETYKTLKQNGQVISSQRISKDTYKRH